MSLYLRHAVLSCQAAVPARRGPGRRGFTTLEIILVVVALAIIVAAGVPGLLGAIQRYRVRGGADQVMGELRRIQSLAMTSGTRHRLRLRDCDPPPCKEYRIEKIGTAWPALGDGTGTNANVLTEWIDLQRNYGGVRITSLTDNSGASVDDIIFDSRGAATSSTGTYPVTISVANAAGVQRTVQVRTAGGVKMQ